MEKDQNHSEECNLMVHTLPDIIQSHSNPTRKNHIKISCMGMVAAVQRIYYDIAVATGKGLSATFRKAFDCIVKVYRTNVFCCFVGSATFVPNCCQQKRNTTSNDRSIVDMYSLNF